MANNFCKNLSNTAHFQEVNGQLFFQPCCWVSKDSAPINDKLDLLLARKRIEIQVDSDRETHCNQCISREKYNFNLSYRQRATSFIPDDATYGDVYVLNVQVDNTCNAACVTCGPDFSSLWEKQINPDAKLRDFSHQYEKLITSVNLNKLRKITFAGGEPLLSKHNVDVLKNIPNPKDVVITYSTNVGVFPSTELIDLWKHFAMVDINLSIDGTDEQFEYIRWPLLWTKINDNVDRYREIAPTLNITFRVNMTVNPLNIFYYSKLDDWCRSKSLPLNISACYGLWGIDSTPVKIRQYIEEKYGSNHKLVNLLKAHPEVNGKFDNLIADAVDLDNKRKLDHAHVFAEVLRIVSQ